MKIASSFSTFNPEILVDQLVPIALVHDNHSKALLHHKLLLFQSPTSN